MLFGVTDLPYVAHEATVPLSSRLSVLPSSALMEPYSLRELHRGMRKIACTDYPFKKADKEEQITAEVKFMKKLASRMTVPEHCISGRPAVTHLTSTRLRDVILYNKEYEPALYEKMKGSIEALSPFIPAKDNADNALPDVFISRQDWENPRDTFDHQVVILKRKKQKEATILVGLPETQYFFE